MHLNWPCVNVNDDGFLKWREDSSQISGVRSFVFVVCPELFQYRYSWHRVLQRDEVNIEVRMENDNNIFDLKIAHCMNRDTNLHFLLWSPLRCHRHHLRQ